ncbi:Aste57867_18577 [Aphanomyces stellatus]|uniref:RBR-type E3 ubiquitin transferase n=1 Tax=Aphanomyces stellatus TaxID=120398 RepID=A0A485LCB1_9STRA|nr:hypothetical protein As57867_018515 [Aphanomyces stellatus]VFT95313.1 Aste57867_18577 [Aphanomyces stellatus]
MMEAMLHPHAGLLLTYDTTTTHPSSCGNALELDVDDEIVVSAIDIAIDIAGPAHNDVKVTLPLDDDAIEDVGRRPTCSICLDSVPPNASTQPAEMNEVAAVTLTCSHVYCKECIQTYVTKKVEGREVEPSQLKCPTLHCHRSLDLVDMLQTMTEATFLKYMRFKRMNEFEKLPHGRWCPNPQCEHMVDCDPAKATFQCTDCKTKGCYKCGNASHPFRTCHQAMDRQYREWEAAQKANASPIKPCPTCQYRIWKLDGCNHMTCVKCRHEWCWVCQLPWSRHNRELCRVFEILSSKYWGPWFPIRFVTKTIAIPVALALGLVGGGLLVVGGVGYGLFYYLPRLVRNKIQRWQRQRHRKTIAPLTAFASQIQQGVHVYFQTPEAMTDVLPTLARGGGRWRPRTQQYVQYVTSSGDRRSLASSSGDFVAYLSSRESRRVTDTPNYFTLIVLHGTAELPPEAVVDGLIQNHVVRHLSLSRASDYSGFGRQGQVMLVVDAISANTLSPAQAQALRLLQARRTNARVLCVPNIEANGALNADYLETIYTSLFHEFGETRRRS